MRGPVSVVVATRDRPLQLQATLLALVRSLRDGDELVVVDSASTLDAVRRVAKGAGAVVIRCESPGACRARNAGWRAAKAPVVAFTDDDCEPEEGWLDALGSCFERHREIGFVTGPVRPLEVRKRRSSLAISVIDGSEVVIFEPGSPAQGIGHGANMAWRRSALENIGGFDESLGPGTPLRAAEDQDAFWRALRSGAVGRFEPAAVVHHRQWRGLAGQLHAYFGYGIGSGAFAAKRCSITAPGLLGREAGSTRASREVLSQGVRAVTSCVREGHELGAAAEATKLLGGMLGVLRARSYDVDGHHFVRTRP